MTLRSSLLPVFTSARTLIDNLGLRQHRVFVRTDQWSIEDHLGTLVSSSLEITPRPKVEPAGDRRVKVSKVTPSYVGGGFTPEMLLPSIGPGKQFLYIVRGPDLEDVPYVLENVESHRNFGYTLHLTQLHWRGPEF